MDTGIIGHLELPKMDGREIAPNIILIGEPTPAPNNKFRCLAQVGHALYVVELSLNILVPNVYSTAKTSHNLG